MDLDYIKAVDVLGQLRVGNSISEALRDEAGEVARAVFDKHKDKCDIDAIFSLLDHSMVSAQLRNSWTDAICDVWLEQR
ncbi:hypothetical protein D515_03055 [Grimontia indica]|uniref:Uncharacterized protein n=2 Tax=Grimontia TaxID=246861 RepID=A0A128FKX3_9GAMM|nr:MULTISPECIES: hypothetical protein [Grimontia]EOD78273.1 hypothetical protein D515_03055 [Grimontia indica]WRW00822.1 hypothetical protein VP504_20465 [Grimontia sp. NTOU-MAR1]CZF86924.1 hypothetical protein GMA8713_04965 [Grimontia marina]